MKTCETCRYYMASPLQEPCESCYWDGTIGQDLTNWKAPTNADRIRAMSDEELAVWMCDRSCSLCPMKDCKGRMEVGRTVCYNRWFDWLRQEVTE